MDLLFVAVAVTAHELVYAAGGIDEFLLAGEEGVRRAGDFKFNQRISLAVDFDSLFRCYGRASDKYLVIRHIFEGNFAI